MGDQFNTNNNFLSPKFDALLALTTSGVQPPIPNARPLDNLHNFRRFLPPDHPQYLAPKTDIGVSQAGTTADKERGKQRVTYLQQERERQKGRARINPIDEIAARFSEGPLGLLSRCYKQRSAVRVVTRHDRGIRGVATGTLVAFDKHMNLVLRDVEESYTVLLSVERPTQHGGMRRCRKQEKRHRRLKQVFLAGNSVALVSCIT